MSSARQRQTLYMLYKQGYIDSRLCSYLDEVYYEQTNTHPVVSPTFTFKTHLTSTTADAAAE